MHKRILSTPAVAVRQPVNNVTIKPLLKIALDAHLAWHVIALHEEGSSPKPPQRFRPPDLLKWVGQKLAAGWQVVTCYEAGPFGYALDRFCAGNPKALALVRVPTEAEERSRSEGRIRQSLKRDLKLIAQRGRGLALQYGYRLKGKWYGARNWPKLEAPAWLVELLQPLRTALMALHEQVRVQGERIESASHVPRPKGMGALSEQIIEREVGDWNRFKNRRQVSSYLGLCPSENSSGPRQHQGGVTKCGNPRWRWALCELAWRLLKFQPGYRLCQKWRAQIIDPRTVGGRKKQLIVALARGFGVDWWRLRTGQTTPDKLGLVMAD